MENPYEMTDEELDIRAEAFDTLEKMYQISEENN
jgi:hypothetical protein